MWIRNPWWPPLRNLLFNIEQYGKLNIRFSLATTNVIDHKQYIYSGHRWSLKKFYMENGLTLVWCKNRSHISDHNFIPVVLNIGKLFAYRYEIIYK
jgi:hypothetical protein